MKRVLIEVKEGVIERITVDPDLVDTTFIIRDFDTDGKGESVYQERGGKGRFFTEVEFPADVADLDTLETPPFAIPVVDDDADPVFALEIDGDDDDVTIDVEDFEEE